MFCCFGAQNEDEKPPPILDVEKVLHDHVWDICRNTFCRRTCMRRRDYIIHVPMNFFHFETISKPEFVDRISPQLKGKDGHILDQTHRTDTVEIATDFVNDTDSEQTYKFRLEKTRKASLNVTMQKGFSIGGKANITIGLPKLASNSRVGVETDLRLNISKTEGENVEQTIVLETTSDIKVKENSKYVAKVLLTETNVSYDFTIRSRMSMPTGSAPVEVIRKRDKKVIYSASLTSLKHIFESYVKEKENENAIRIGTIPSDLPTENYVVEFLTKGIIDGVRLSDQRIILESEKLRRNDGTSGPVIEEVVEEDGNINRVE